MNILNIMTGGVVALLLASGVMAQSTVYSFGNITNNNPADAMTAGQYTMEVSTVSLATGEALGPNEVAFIFRNEGPADSAITRVYFEDGTLLDLAQINNMNDWTNFTQGANPGDPPGGNGLDTPFETTQDFLASSSGNPEVNGVNPGEAVEIIFDLQSGYTYFDVIAALEQGFIDPTTGLSLRVAIHVQAFSSGGSEAFIVTVPLPAPVWMAMAGLGGTVLLRRRMFR